MGLHAIQVAKTLGAHVIAVTTSAGKTDAIRSADADEVAVAPEAVYRKQIAELTKGRLPDLFLEIAGSATLEQSILSVRRGGRVVVIGNPDGGTCRFNPALLILRGELMLYGALGITLPEFEDLLALIAESRLRPRIAESAPLAELPRLMSEMEARTSIGRVVVRPN